MLLTDCHLVKYAKERPGRLTYGSAGIGTLQHVWGTILFKSLGMDALHVREKKSIKLNYPHMFFGRERQIVDSLGNGARTIPEMVKVIYADVPEKLHVMAGKSVHSHLKKLKKDGRVAEERLANAPSRWTLL